MGLASAQFNAIASVTTTISTGLGSIVIGSNESVSFASGTSDGQADREYSTAGTATTSPTSLDLNGGSSLLGKDGTVFSIVDLVGFRLKNTTAAGGGSLDYGGGSNPVANLAGRLPPGAVAEFFDATGSGLPVVAATGDILKLVATTGSLTYDLILIGRSV